MSDDLPFNFLGLPKEFSTLERAKIAVLPVPFDLTSTYIKGADRGPKALIEASRAVELYDIETDSEVYKHGIATLSEVRTGSAEEGYWV